MLSIPKCRKIFKQQKRKKKIVSFFARDKFIYQWGKKIHYQLIKDFTENPSFLDGGVTKILQIMLKIQFNRFEISVIDCELEVEGKFNRMCEKT